MTEVTEVVKITATPAENGYLAELFKDFYKLAVDVKIDKLTFVTKASYDKTLRAKLRERTAFEADKSFKEHIPTANLLGLQILKAQISITFPSSRVLTLTETLTEPNGLTKLVELTDSDGESCTFDKYNEAEGEVVARLVTEQGVLLGNIR